MAAFGDVGVERTREPFVPRHDDQQNVLFFPLRQQRMLRHAGLWIVNLGSRDKRLQHIRQHLRIRTRGQRALLGAA